MRNRDKEHLLEELDSIAAQFEFGDKERAFRSLVKVTQDLIERIAVLEARMP